MLVPAHLVSNEGVLLSHVYLNYDNRDQYGYPSVDGSRRYRVCKDAPKMKITSYASANVTITEEGRLYDLFKRRIIEVPELEGREIVNVFDIGDKDEFDFAVVDSTGCLIEVKNFRYPEVSYTVVAEGVKCVVPNSQELYRYVFVNSEGQWVSKQAHHDGTLPIEGTVLPKVEEIKSIQSGFVFTESGIFFLDHPTSVGFGIPPVRFFKFENSTGITGMVQHNAWRAGKRDGDLVKVLASVTNYLKNGKIFSDDRLKGVPTQGGRVVYDVIDYGYPTLDKWDQIKSKTKFIGLREFGTHTLAVDTAGDVYIINKNWNRFKKFPELKGLL